MELDGFTRGLVALNCELVQLCQISFKKSITRLREVPHLEVALNLDQNRHKLLVQLSFLEHESMQSWRLEELDQFCHKCSDEGYPLVSRLK